MIDLEKKLLIKYNSYHDSYYISSLAQLQDQLNNYLGNAKRMLGDKRSSWYIKSQVLPEGFNIFKFTEPQIDREALGAYIEMIATHNHEMEILQNSINDKVFASKEKRRKQYLKLKEEFENET